MDREQIFERLIAVFQEVFGNDTIVPSEDMTADDVEEWDSLSHIRLIVSIEQVFGIRFDTAEVHGAENVGAFVNIIAAKI